MLEKDLFVLYILGILGGLSWLSGYFQTKHGTINEIIKHWEWLFQGRIIDWVLSGQMAFDVLCTFAIFICLRGALRTAKYHLILFDKFFEVKTLFGYKMLPYKDIKSYSYPPSTSIGGITIEFINGERLSIPAAIGRDEIIEKIREKVGVIFKDRYEDRGLGKGLFWYFICIGGFFIFNTAIGSKMGLRLHGGVSHVSGIIIVTLIILYAVYYGGVNIRITDQGIHRRSYFYPTTTIKWGDIVAIKIKGRLESRVYGTMKVYSEQCTVEGNGGKKLVFRNSIDNYQELIALVEQETGLKAEYKREN